jgi:tRNA A-37 threonylcarbamoyl transferase component Bud32
VTSIEDFGRGFDVSLRPYEIDYDGSLLLGDSAHHAMLVSDDNDNKWVLKSNEVSYAKASNEIEMLKRFQREGVPTLPFNEKKQPFIMKLDDKADAAAELFLPYVEGLQPLTRLEWEVEVGTDDYSKRLKDLELCINLAAKMHRRGFVHGDFQIKNIGQLRSGKHITFDLENAAEINPKTQISDRAGDLVSLLKSTRLNGLFSSTKPHVVEDEVANVLFKYTEKFDLDDSSIQVVEVAQTRFMEWSNDPEAIKRALSRFMITRA